MSEKGFIAGKLPFASPIRFGVHPRWYFLFWIDFAPRHALDYTNNWHRIFYWWICHYPAKHFCIYLPIISHPCCISVCVSETFILYIWRAADKAQYTFNLGRHEGQDRSNVLLKFLDSDTEKLGLVLRNLANGKSLDCARLS